MTKNSLVSVHWSFWVIGVITLIWNVLGGINFFMQMNVDVVAAMPETHRTVIEGRPMWATAGFALAVFGGALGCLLLLLKTAKGYYLFVASLFGVIVAMAYTLSLGFEFNTVEFIMMVIMPTVVAVFLIWYCKWTQNKNWIS